MADAPPISQNPDIRFLGRLLGDVIRAHEGEARTPVVFLGGGAMTVSLRAALKARIAAELELGAGAHPAGAAHAVSRSAGPARRAPGPARRRDGRP